MLMNKFLSLNKKLDERFGVGKIIFSAHLFQNLNAHN